MSVATKFQNFCTEVRIKADNIDSISYRCKRITKELNKDLWDTESETSHSLYVGSYGRDTAINVSDIDIIFQLPSSKYFQYDSYNGNGQSALLQEVRKSIEKTYSVTNIGADGQVIVIPFSDGIKFEVVPAFNNKDDSFTFADSNNGGKWRTTDPRPEIKAIKERNDDYFGNLKALCRMARAWKDNWDVPIGGLLIDTLAYDFIENWEYNDKSYLYYDYMTRDFFNYLKDQNEEQKYWLSPGSRQYVYRKGGFEYKALRCYNLAKEAIDHEQKSENYAADQKWKEIYGSKFTG